MSDLVFYCVRLEQMFQEFTGADGGVDVKSVGDIGGINKRIDEGRTILVEMPLGLTQLEERMYNDPDFPRFSRKSKLEALADYLRFAIGLIHRQPTSVRGRIIFGANDD